MDHNGVGQQPCMVGPNTGRDWGHRGRLFQGQPGLCPQPGAVSNSSISSHLPLPCGNQSLLRKVSTNAPLAPGAIDARSRNISVGLPTPTSSGRALMHVTLMCLLWFSEAPPEAQLCPLRPLPPGDMGCSHFGGQGVLNTGIGTGVMGLFLRTGSGGRSGTATWPQVRLERLPPGSVGLGNGLSGLIPKPCPSQSHPTECQRRLPIVWTTARP